jgi:integrase
MRLSRVARQVEGGNFRRQHSDPAVREMQDGDRGFPKVTMHGLRHTAASLAAVAGANVKSVQRMLGHASAAMTLDVYTDPFDDDLDAVAVALNDHASRAVVGRTWAKRDGVPLTKNADPQ